LTAKEIFEKLLNEDKILSMSGKIKFFFGEVDIVVKQKDVVGNIIQEWLQGWLDKRGIEYALNDNSQMPPDFFKNKIFYSVNPNSQMPPDFFLSEDKTKNLLEVKAFNRNASPGFDIADFRMYSQEIINKPYMLHADYLIFGYDMNDEGIVTIKDLWLKKIWEITKPMRKWPLTLKITNGLAQEIRPCTWYATKTDTKVFESLEDFLSAFEAAIFQNPETRPEAPQWRKNFLKNYAKHYGREIKIPKWENIKEKYISN